MFAVAGGAPNQPLAAGSQRPSGGEAPAAKHVINLKAARFFTDELVSGAGRRTFLPPDVLASLPQDLVKKDFAAGSSSELYIVQAPSPAELATLYSWLQASHLPVLEYLPQAAYLVRLTPESMHSLADRPEVFWLGQFQPAFRIAPALERLSRMRPLSRFKARADFALAGDWTTERLVRSLRAKGAIILRTSTGRGKVSVLLAAKATVIRRLAGLPACLWIEPAPRPRLLNDRARTSFEVPTGHGGASGAVMNVENVWARGLHGEGQIAAVADTGLSTGDLSTLHKDFGDQSDAGNPMRVVQEHALGRPGVWDDDESVGGAKGEGGHGTHASGSLAGNGVQSGASPASNLFPDGSYAGTVPKVQLVIQSLMDANGFGLGGLNQLANLRDLFSPPYGDGARVHSNSWGGLGGYDSQAQDVDEFVWEHPDFVILAAAGNDGADGQVVNDAGQCVADGQPIDGVVDPGSINTPATGKNLIAIGASESYRPDFTYQTPTQPCTAATYGNSVSRCQFSIDPLNHDPISDHAAGLAAFSSRGPASDGRFKPDLVAPGTAIISTRSDKNQRPLDEWGACQLSPALAPLYVPKVGTSMSTPLAAGAAVLVRQYFVDGWHANHSVTTNPAPVSGHGFNPSAALVKATLLHGAWDLAPGQYGSGPAREIPPAWDIGHDLPNNAEGFGRIDLERALFPGAATTDDPNRRMAVHDESAGLATGAARTYTFRITSSAGPLVATLVWSDPAPAGSAGLALVNDLDLTATAPDGTLYYPNGIDRTAAGGCAGNPAKDPGIDCVNNVEQIKITAPAAGSWTIQVRGYQVPGNGTPGTNAQPYALVISGIQAAACTVPVFSSSYFPATTSAPHYVVTGDFNHDGALDLAIADFNAGQVAVLLGDGRGSFGAPRGFAVGIQPAAIAVGDFNHDGNLDLAVANDTGGGGPNTVSILLGDGTGSFSRAPDVTVEQTPLAIAAGDFNEDGNLDLAVVNWFSSTVSILLGDGHGGFQAAPSLSLTVSDTQGLAVGDFDGDGHLDVAVHEGIEVSTVTVFFGDGSGRFPRNISYGKYGGGAPMIAADFNGDGKLDLILSESAAGEALVLLGDGAGGFGRASRYSLWRPGVWQLAAADFNGDGLLDLAATAYHNLVVAPGIGGGAVGAPALFGGASSISSLAVGDFNGDGKPDLAVVTADSTQVRIMLNTFQPGIAPVARVSGSATLCAGGGATLGLDLAGSPPWNVTWSDGLVQTGVTRPHLTRTVSPGASTVYVVTAASDAVCQGETVGVASVIVHPLPAPPAAATNGPLCAGQALQLSAAGAAGAAYAWSGPHGFSSTAARPVVPAAQPSASGAYSVTQTVNGCSSPPATVNALVRPLPTAAVSGGRLSCPGSGSTIQAALTGTAPWVLDWSDGVSQSGIESTPALRQVTPTADTTFTITSLTDAFCAGTSSGSATISMDGPCAKFFTVVPCRLVDTRQPVGPTGGPALQPGSTRDFAVTDLCGIPAGAKALAVNVTIYQPAAPGDLRLYPGGMGSVPLVSTINWVPGETRANNAVVQLGASPSGALEVKVDSGGTVHLILDVTGYFE